ncbi:MAG: translation initiation factor IF-3 [Deltaproteobacteria bacterium]|nr:translation initiation factor IF-3 [Deltaproteobacteria bacterium]MDP3016347.1 translation initiation factor IF-3 [Deltaproteobacteria bacterium]
MGFISRDVRINREIRAKEVRVIDSEGKQLGILPLVEALRVAANADLDLVEVSPKSEPPVCRIMDFGKFKYQQSKKAHDAKKKQAVVHLKEVKLRAKTEEHDLEFKLRHIERFLKEGNKTKVTIIFRGREITHSDLGKQMMGRIAEKAKEWGKIEQPAKFEGRNYVMILAPLPSQKTP